MKKYNSVKTMVQVLKEVGPMTEREIQMTCFGYDRNRTWKSNKKYADMLRRGLRKGIIGRFEIPSQAICRAQFMYYATKEIKVPCSAELDNEWANESI